MRAPRNPWVYVTLWFLIAVLAALLLGCKGSEPPEARPIKVEAPDSLPDPLAANGWEFRRTSARGGVYLPPPVPPKKVKYKNVGNTTVKDNNNTKAKGEAIIGHNNAPVEAKKHAIIGDGNTVKKTESLWWLWLLVGAAAMGAAWWYRKYG